MYCKNLADVQCGALKYMFAISFNRHLLQSVAVAWIVWWPFQLLAGAGLIFNGRVHTPLASVA